MYYTQDVKEFFKLNHSEIQKAVNKICSDYGLSSHTDTVTSNLYYRFLTRKTLEKFDPKHESGTKIGTYIYRVIKNIAGAQKAEKEQNIERHRYITTDFNFSNPYSNQDEFDHAISSQGLDIDYQNTLYSNYASEAPDGLTFDLNMFESYLKKINRTFTLGRRKNLTKGHKGVSLLKIFCLMRQGYSNKFIAYKLGTSVTFITSMKKEISLYMIKFGILWGSNC